MVTITKMKQKGVQTVIEKMKFLSITGHKDDIDRVIDQYLSKYEIQFENALSELKTVHDLRPFMESNPYKDVYQRSCELVSSFPEASVAAAEDISLEDAVKLVTDFRSRLDELNSQKETLTQSLETYRASLDKVSHFTGLDYDLSSILHFKYIKFRFGRIAKEYYDKFYRYVYDSIDTVLYKCVEDSEYIWLVYFVPESICDRVDAIYASMHFERTFLPDEYEGTPMEAVSRLTAKVQELESQIQTIESQIAAAAESEKSGLLAANKRLTAFTKNFDIRKLAACTKHKDEHTYYILCGWMSEKDADRLQREMADDTMAFCIVEDDHNNITSRPPTKLKNPKLFKPFEMYVDMYGLPAYNEMDPTILIGITYSFLFGFMFGDVGQGLCLMIGGWLLYHFKKMNLAGIISRCGFFSTIFGFLFGSFFGFEDVIPALWLHPKTNMMKVPFIGNLNTVFVIAIALGMGIILLTMVLNIRNSLREHNTEKIWFDTNGVAGLVFYGALAATIVLYMTGHALPATAVLAVMFLLPLLVIFCKEPLTALVEKKGEIMPESKVMFFVQGFFELFEVCLSYFSNTLSFVRVGAFAVSHAAMMEVVLMLAGAEAGGSPNWLVVVLGNAFVCGMEGLIVGIQVLRLEYYELFSRFYRGTGREFKPYGKA